METEEARLGIGSSTGVTRSGGAGGVQLPWQTSLERSQARFRVHSIKQELADAQHECELARTQLSQRRAQLQQRRERLAKARALEAQDQALASRLTTANTQLQHRLTTKTQLQLHRQRVHLLRALEEIYPIDLFPDDGSSNNFLFSISQIPLPSSELILSPSEKHDQETTAAALGLVAQLVSLLSAYLDTPIHYPLATAGSRSVVQDPISLMNGPRAFPLYSKSVEAYRFEYAIFLLNKDIEQLVNEHHVPLIDLRQTLPNLKNLMNTIISASSPKAYTSQSARRHISAKQIALLQSTSSSSANTSFVSNRHPSIATTAGGTSPITSSPPQSVTLNNHHLNHNHHHHHLGRGHPPFSSASSSSSTSEQQQQQLQIQQRLQSNASVSLSIASAESSTNSSEITLPGSGNNGLPQRRQQQQLGSSNANNRRSISSASAASTWAASLLGWKTFSPTSTAPSPTASSTPAAVIDKAGDKNGHAAVGNGSTAELGHTAGANGDAVERDDEAHQAEPPTVRRLGAGGSKK
ncbi:hypothetical protein OC846_001224 [Tilletia horrida]|uniref:Autophagy-related protein 14 n=1 Tax=Tilletia horrida TaxID=155126 RepID=A0AAN6GVQ7_9BASI|nr:hypothetical protein OC846_001224 [Tilletia horrida]KAK0569299.1 hypothetical protein OC861_001116 [Tilletia horrida]